MNVVTLASVRGAPGVTTTALLLASTFDDGVVVEADLDGGALAVRYGLGREPGLTTFAASSDAGDRGWRAHAQDAAGVAVLVGPDAPAASTALWRTAGDRIAGKLITAGGTAIVDAGRVRALVPLVAASQLLIVLVRPIAEHLVALTHLLPTLQQSIDGQVAMVLVGHGPYRPEDVEASLDARVLCALPDDRGTAEALRAGTSSGSRLSRSALARADAALGSKVRSAITEPEEVVAP
jgi:hypothetical protein